MKFRLSNWCMILVLTFYVRFLLLATCMCLSQLEVFYFLHCRFVYNRVRNERTENLTIIPNVKKEREFGYFILRKLLIRSLIIGSQ